MDVRRLGRAVLSTKETRARHQHESTGLPIMANSLSDQYHIGLDNPTPRLHFAHELTFIFGLHSASWSSGKMPLCGGLTNCLPELKFMLAILSVFPSGYVCFVLMTRRLFNDRGRIEAVGGMVVAPVAPSLTGGHELFPIFISAAGSPHAQSDDDYVARNSY